MLSPEKIFSLSGIISDVFFYLFPLISFIDLFRKKINYKETPIFIIILIYYNSFFSFIYGKIIFNKYIRISNLIGCIISFIFICIYLLYQCKEYVGDSILNGLLLVLSSVASARAIYLFIFNKGIIGKIYIISTIIVSVSPFLLIYKLRKNKQNSGLPAYIGVTIFVKCLFWYLYARKIYNNYMKISNLIRIGIACLLFICWSLYRRQFMMQSKNLIEYGIKGNERKKILYEENENKEEIENSE